MKKKTRRRPHPKPKSKHITRKAPAQPMVVYRNNRPVQLEQKQVDLIKSICAKDSTPEEFELFMQICRKSRLDPFKKEIYFVKFETKRGPQMVIMTGIDGFRSMAARDHKDFGGTSAAVFTWFDPPQLTLRANKRIPETATVTAYRKGGVSATATAYWEEFAPADMAADRSDFWRRMPKVMLEKCAEARALRKCFPGLGNIFTHEEMDQKLQDYTEEGRQIHTDGVAPSGSVVDPRIAAKADQQRILDEKLSHGHPPGTPAAKNAEAALQRVEEEDRRFNEAKKISGKPEAKPETTTASASKKSEVGASSLAGTTLINGNLLRVIQSKTKNNAECLDVQIGNVHYRCYHKSLFSPILQFGKMGGFRIMAFIDKRGTIQGLKQVGPVIFQADGKTPIDTSREPGSDG